MHLLVLDSIHGGAVIGDRLARSGHEVDLVDVYRGRTGISPREAAGNRYDLVIAPVHLDPSYFLLRELTAPCITHHEAVRWILGRQEGWIEISGMRGKTTTAAALASILPGRGVLQSSGGLFRYPGREQITRMSITPASLIRAKEMMQPGDWLVSEISLGFTGIGDLAILTSGEDYRVAGGRKSAFRVKEDTAFLAGRLLVPPGVDVRHDAGIYVEDLVSVTRNRLHYHWNGMEGVVDNPLICLPGYGTAMQLAAAAALLLGHCPDGLAGFTSVPGRMEIIREGSSVCIDNANSGSCANTTLNAVDVGRELVPTGDLCLIIGQEAASVCENFETGEILSSLAGAQPAGVILIAGDYHIDAGAVAAWCGNQGIDFRQEATLSDARASVSGRYPLIVISVKTWR